MQEKNEKEVWKDVVGYKGLYKVSSLGRVKRLSRSYTNSIGKVMNLKERLLKPNRIKGGYYQLKLTKNRKEKSILLHRIVCEAFQGPAPKGRNFVNHRDTNKENNREDNLEWCSFQENMDHAASHGLRPRGSGHFKSKLSEEDVLEICRIIDNKEMNKSQVARKFGVDHRTVGYIYSGKSWNWLTRRKPDDP